MNLGAIHQSLTNSDKIRLIIQKHKALYYPLGSSRLAIAYEWQINHQNSEDRVRIDPELFWNRFRTNS